MKSLFNIALSTLSVVTISVAATLVSASPSLAQDLVVIKNNPNRINKIAPVHLVQIGYQGFLSEQGVSSGAKFVADVNRGDITPETLVRSAIEKGRLSPETLNDSTYLNIIQSELDDLNRG